MVAGHVFKLSICAHMHSWKVEASLALRVSFKFLMAHFGCWESSSSPVLAWLSKNLELGFYLHYEFFHKFSFSQNLNLYLKLNVTKLTSYNLFLIWQKGHWLWHQTWILIKTQLSTCYVPWISQLNSLGRRKHFWNGRIRTSKNLFIHYKQ